jgi:hypothetical protein
VPDWRLMTAPRRRPDDDDPVERVARQHPVIPIRKSAKCTCPCGHPLIDHFVGVDEVMGCERAGCECAW